MARKYITPLALPQGSTAYCIQIPDRPEYFAILRGMLLTLSRCDTWEQVPGYGISATDAAAWAEVMLVSLEEKTDCSQS